jgi:hypothetical protein
MQRAWAHGFADAAGPEDQGFDRSIVGEHRTDDIGFAYSRGAGCNPGTGRCERFRSLPGPVVNDDVETGAQKALDHARPHFARFR